MYRIVNYSLLLLSFSLITYFKSTPNEITHTIVTIGNNSEDHLKSLSIQELITDATAALNFVGELLKPIVSILEKLEIAENLNEQDQLKNKLIDMNNDDNVIKTHFISCEICYTYVNEINTRINTMQSNSAREHVSLKFLKTILLKHFDNLLKIQKICDPLFYPKQ